MATLYSLRNTAMKVRKHRKEGIKSHLTSKSAMGREVFRVCWLFIADVHSEGEDMYTQHLIGILIALGKNPWLRNNEAGKYVHIDTQIGYTS